MATPPERQTAQRKMLGSPEIRSMLSDYVRRRVPDHDVDDVVQTVLMEALASETVPAEKVELRKWLTGVARHKIADLHRRAGRERPAELPDIETAPAPIEEQELARWAQKQAGASKDAGATLSWMAREGEGDKLEHIAAEEKLPAATVRQRVSRMRRWMREQWRAELAAAAAMLAVLVFLLVKYVFVPAPDQSVKKEPAPIPPESAGPVQPPPGPSPAPVAKSPVERAAELRREALPICGAEPRACLDKLDEADKLDPAGASAPEVREAREQARKKLTDDLQAPSTTPPSEPSAKAPPGPSAAPPTRTSPTTSPKPPTPSPKSAPPVKSFEKESKESKAAPSKPMSKPSSMEPVEVNNAGPSTRSSDTGSKLAPTPAPTPTFAPPQQAPEPQAPRSYQSKKKGG